MEGKKFHIRTGIIAALTAAMFLCFFILLYHYQIVQKIDQSTAQSLNTLSSVESVPAARGIITDRDGNELVGNQTQYQVTLDLDKMGDAAAQGAAVEQLIEICRAHDIAWTDTELPISAKPPYVFTGENTYTYVDSDSGETKPTRLGRLCDAMKWEKSEDAADLLSQMAETFGLTELSESEQRDALGVLYSCYLRKKEILWTDYVFVSDVDISFISVVKERSLPGVSIDPVSVRAYPQPYAAHLLGRVGLITAENWDEGENYKAQGYSMDDSVGQSGVEYAFESYLKGTPGERTITVDKEGNTVSVEDTVAAKAGDTVALTLDGGLQAAAEDALAEYVPQLNNSTGGGAAVAIDVHNGGVLACANWPTFDAETMTYDEAYDSLSPLFNRALQGTYSPGSTYKMVTATAGLETGVITPTTQIQDTGIMDYYGTQFRCWLYRQNGATHGMETVSDALRDSCNIFFYHVGIDVGIETLTQYAQAYGLGEPTGIELAESTGVNAGPEYSASVGATWYAGNTLSAAIGQSDNLFTPLQIANYVATLVNGGTRYSAHLLQRVTDADGNVTEYEPKVLNTVELQSQNLDAIKQGMLEVVQNTKSVASAFKNLTDAGIQVGAKTGSAQVTGQENANGLFVCFAPYDDPQIAVCVAVEKGGSGAATAVIAAKMLEQYFGIEPQTDAADQTAQDAAPADTTTQDTADTAAARHRSTRRAAADAQPAEDTDGGNDDAAPAEDDAAPADEDTTAPSGDAPPADEGE